MTGQLALLRSDIQTLAYHTLSWRVNMLAFNHICRAMCSSARCIAPHLVAFHAFVSARRQMRARVFFLLRLPLGPLFTHASNGEEPDD
mgnify:CR=1 FL=1